MTAINLSTTSAPYSLSSHSLQYSLSKNEIIKSILTGFSGICYASRHMELARGHADLSLGHRIIAYIEYVPILGALVALVEKIVISLFFSSTTRETSLVENNATQRSAATDALSQAAIINEPTVIPIPFPKEERLIEDGYGEFIIRYRDGSALDEKVFKEKTFPLFKEFHPIRWAEEHPNKDSHERILSLRSRLNDIDPNLEAIFIPRVIYEIEFLRQSIIYDLITETTHEHNRFCNPWLNADVRVITKNGQFSRVDTSTLKEDEIEEIAFKLNQVFIELFQKNGFRGSLRFSQIVTIFNDQVIFFETLRDPNSDKAQIMSHNRYDIDIPINRCRAKRGSPCSLSIDLETKDILQRALELECSDEAKGKVVLYRGGKLISDSPIRPLINGQIQPHSISYGTSLFGGSIRDIMGKGACAYVYMIKPHLDGYGLIYDPQSEEDKELFDVPALTVLENLYGKGECFHARSKAFHRDSAEGSRIGGFLASYNERAEYYHSNLSQDALVDVFNRAMQNAYMLSVRQDQRAIA